MKSKDGTTHIRKFPLMIDGRRTMVGVIRETAFNWGKWFAFGHQFGPTLFVKAMDEGEVLDVWDEHCGERVDPSDPALLDYDVTDGQLKEADGGRLGACFFAAMNCGDIRMNDGGTVVWVDPH